MYCLYHSVYNSISCYNYSNKRKYKNDCYDRVFGYSQKECCSAILGGYRPMSYIGFVIGTVYQYVLLRIMVDIVFKDVEGVPIYKFDFPVMLISLAMFIAIYEILMYVYSEKIKKISIKEIMIE